MLYDTKALAGDVINAPAHLFDWCVSTEKSREHRNAKDNSKSISPIYSEAAHHAQSSFEHGLLSHGGGAVAVGDGVSVRHHVRGRRCHCEDVTLGEGGEVADVLELFECGERIELEILAGMLQTKHSSS